MAAPRDYRYIRAWGRFMGSFEYYIKAQQERASAEGAPLDATFESDGRWHTYAGITSESTRAAIDRLMVTA